MGIQVFLYSILGSEVYICGIEEFRSDIMPLIVLGSYQNIGIASMWIFHGLLSLHWLSHQ